MCAYKRDSSERPRAIPTRLVNYDYLTVANPWIPSHFPASLNASSISGSDGRGACMRAIVPFLSMMM